MSQTDPHHPLSAQVIHTSWKWMTIIITIALFHNKLPSPALATQSTSSTSSQLQLVSPQVDSASAHASPTQPLFALFNHRAGSISINANNPTALLDASHSGASTATSAASGNPYQLRLLTKPDESGMLYVNLVPVNYTNHHEPSVDVRYQSKYPYVTIDEKLPNNTVVAAVVVSDADIGPSGEVDLAIEQGNELGHFKLVCTPNTNTIQINGAPLSKHRMPEYNLTIVARDRGQPPKSSSVNLVIKVNASTSSYLLMNPNLSPEPLPSSKQPINDLIYVGTMLVIIFSVVISIIIIACALVRRPTIKKSPPPRTTSTINSIMKNDRFHRLGQTNL